MHFELVLALDGFFSCERDLVVDFDETSSCIVEDGAALVLDGFALTSMSGWQASLNVRLVVIEND